MFGPTISPQLVQSGKGRIASDPALLNLSRPLMVGAFSVRGPHAFLGSNEATYSLRQGGVLKRYGLPKPMVERALIKVYETVVLDQQRYRDHS
jgi:hypothetical protein